MGSSFNFEREQIVDVSLVGTSVTKCATLLGYQEQQFLRHTRIMQRQHQRRGTEQRNRLTERDYHYFEKSQNYCSTDDIRTEY
jgi:hypothetical protein